jgi:hypothetical protein
MGHRGALGQLLESTKIYKLLSFLAYVLKNFAPSPTISPPAATLSALTSSRNQKSLTVERHPPRTHILRMSSEFDGSYENYLHSPLDVELFDGDFTGYDAPFLYHYEDNFPMLDIEPAIEMVDHEALELSHHPFQESYSYTSASDSELALSSGVVPSQLMLQDTGFDAVALYEIDESE